MLLHAGIHHYKMIITPQSHCHLPQVLCCSRGPATATWFLHRAQTLSFTLGKFSVGSRRGKCYSAAEFSCQVHSCLWHSRPALAPVILQPGDPRFHMCSWEGAQIPPLCPYCRRPECPNASAWFPCRSELWSRAIVTVLCLRAPETFLRPLLPFTYKKAEIIWCGGQFFIPITFPRLQL